MTDRSRAPHLITAEDLLRMPDDGRFHELVWGRLIAVSPSGSRSSIVPGRVHARVDSHVRRERIPATGIPDGTVTVLGADGALDGEDVLPGFTLPLAEVWV
jgi:hypothetical protein